jgi:enoyl-CoA hydratase/carnithine racemase
VVLAAAIGKAFCAGHDLKDMKAHTDLDYYQKLFARCSRLMLAIQQLPVPVIARVQGLATAAGCQLVAQCDLAVAVDTARFGVNGIDAGLFCATPSVPLVRNMAPKLAMEMLRDRRVHHAAEAKARPGEPGGRAASCADAEVERLVDAILSKPREALAMGKQLFYQQREMGVAGAYQLASQTMAYNMVHPVAQEGVQAFIDKREPQWPT